MTETKSTRKHTLRINNIDSLYQWIETFVSGSRVSINH